MGRAFFFSVSLHFLGFALLSGIYSLRVPSLSAVPIQIEEVGKKVSVAAIPKKAQPSQTKKGEEPLAPGEPSPVSTPASSSLSMGAVLSVGNQAPQYPALALNQGWEGKLKLQIQLSPEGQVETVQVLDSSGYSVLDEAAVRAARTWRFPSTWASSFTVPVEFVIEGIGRG